MKVFIKLLLICIIIWLLYNKNDDIKQKEIPCRKATIDNPMGNLLPLSKDPELSACNENGRMDKLFHGHYRDPNDYINEANMRRFITMPVTSIYDKRDKFANFIMNGYDDEFKSCKSDGYQCERYRDIRYDFD